MKPASAYQEKVQSALEREGRTIKAMLELYCRDKHAGGRTLCAECGELLDYAYQRLACCPFQGSKPTCAKCPIHCYQPQYRERIKAVMKYAGPRMPLRHPILAARHLLDKFRKPPRAATRHKAQDTK